MPRPPVSKPASAAAYLATTSVRFREIHETLGHTVEAPFPEAEPVFDFGMPGWRIARRRWVDPRSVKGTLDPNWVQVYLVERKSGIAFHLRNPVDFGCTQRRKAELSGVGFKLMVGCIQFNRQSDYPIGAIESLLKDVRSSLEADVCKAEREDRESPMPFHVLPDRVLGQGVKAQAFPLAIGSNRGELLVPKNRHDPAQ